MFRSANIAGTSSQGPFGAEVEELETASSGMALVSPSAIGAVNRARILQALYDNGPTSRAELARLAGVNRTTVTGIVQPLINERLLVEGEPARESGRNGKPARPLFFDPDAPMLGAVLLLPGRIQTALVSLTGEVEAVHRASFDPNQNLAAFRTALFGAMDKTLSRAKLPPFGIGVAAGGMIDSDRGTVLTVSLAPLLDGLPLVGLLEERFRLPAVIDHHPRALLVADRWFGSGRGRQNFAAIYTGEVLGGAFQMDGHVYRGPAGSGGELGHTIVQLGGRTCNCGKRGCWETIATLPWLRGEGARMGLPQPETLDTVRLIALETEGVRAAGELLDTYALHLAVGIANVQQTLALDTYILHGDAAAGGDAMAQRIHKHVGNFVLPRPGRELIVICSGGPDERTALKGAAGLVISDRLKLAL